MSPIYHLFKRLPPPTELARLSEGHLAVLTRANVTSNPLIAFRKGREYNFVRESIDASERVLQDNRQVIIRERNEKLKELEPKRGKRKLPEDERIRKQEEIIAEANKKFSDVEDICSSALREKVKPILDNAFIMSPDDTKVEPYKGVPSVFDYFPFKAPKIPFPVSWPSQTPSSGSGEAGGEMGSGSDDIS